MKETSVSPRGFDARCQSYDVKDASVPVLTGTMPAWTGDECGLGRPSFVSCFLSAFQVRMSANVV